MFFRNRDHFRRNSSAEEFWGTSRVIIPWEDFRRLTTTYPSAVAVWEDRSPEWVMLIHTSG